MKFLSVAEISKKWGMSDRTVRNYCANGQLPGAFLTGKTWNIPENSIKPERVNKSKFSDNALLNLLKEEKDMGLRGGIYHKTQVALAYNSNHIEGSTLTEEQTRMIFETNTIEFENKSVKVDDVVEATNHFRCFDLIIDNAKKKLTEKLIKDIHFNLKVGTEDSRKSWFKVGDYKTRPNEVGGQPTCPVNQVSTRMKKLLEAYNSKEKIALEDIIEFHKNFESIHPFQDGNGRVGRLILFKECLKYNIVPFIIEDDIKMFYYRGLKEWERERGYLIDTCLSSQDKYKAYLDYFDIEY